MTFLDESAWRGKFYQGGWIRGAGGDVAVIEPATGEEIGRIGCAGPSDVAASAARAAAAQPAWVATPHSARSAILRKAADLWLSHAAEIEDWVVRECGKILPAAQFETHNSTGEIYLADKAVHLPVGNPATEQVALGPIIDERQRDKVHELVTASVGAGARLAAGGTYEGLFYQPTVLAEMSPEMPAYAQEVFGPVAPVIRFATADDAAKLAAETEYGLSLGILTRDVMRGLDLANRIPSGIVHINEQTVDDEANIPFGGVGASGTGARFGGGANADAFTDTRWVTIRGDIARYPF